MNGPTPPGGTGHHRRRAIVLVVSFLLLCADVVLTNWDDLFGRDRCDTISLTTRMWYERLVTSGYRKPRPHTTRLVIVASPPGHDFSPCERRAYLARLVNRLGDLKPGILVLDYSFLPRNDCTKNETLELQTAIDNLGEKTRVVFGLYSSTEQELRDSGKTILLDQLKARGFSEHDQVIAPSDITPHSKLVVAGLDRLDCDTRKIPVLWSGRIYPDNGSGNVNSAPVPTISLATARAYDDTIDVELTRAFKKKQNPFTSFVAEDKFRPVNAAEILAGPLPIDSWNLASKIVVVGEESHDIHDSVLGRVPGVVLQANYIESLIDDRHFLSLGPVGVPLATFVCLLLIALIFDRSKTIRTAVSLAGLFWLALLLATYVAFVHFAILFTSWVPALLGIITSFVVKLRE